MPHKSACGATPSNALGIYAQRHAPKIHYDLNHGAGKPPYDANETTAR